MGPSPKLVKILYDNFDQGFGVNSPIHFMSPIHRAP